MLPIWAISSHTLPGNFRPNINGFVSIYFQERSDSISADPSSNSRTNFECQDSLEEVFDTSNEYSNLYTSGQIDEIIAEELAKQWKPKLILLSFSTVENIPSK